MSFIADLHIHSRFANATSPALNILSLARVGARKGVRVMGTGDFTHPAWLQELEDHLSLDYETGLYRVKDEDNMPLFCFSTEISLVYKDGGKLKKIHLLVLAPDQKTVEALNVMLAEYGDLGLDGRPTLLIDPETVVNRIHEISPLCEVIPAHIWTPWFGALGRQYGYDDLASCFQSSLKYIHAIETGLSSDPYMNWLVFKEKDIGIVSFSDAHSLPKIGREATIFSGDMSYSSLITGIRKNEIEYTIEFFPEQGMYHYSGHRKCHIVVDPQKDLIIKGICSVCHKKLTQGVYRRVYDIALEKNSMGYIGLIEKTTTRDAHGFIHLEGRVPFVRLIPLEEVIAASFNIKGLKAKKVLATYESIMEQFGESELSLLMDPPIAMKTDYPLIYENILRVLKGDVGLIPGYDNTYGKVILPTA